MWNWQRVRFALIFLLAAAAAAQSPLPFSDGEELRYRISYPSGLGLGEATMSASLSEAGADTPARWNFAFGLKAAIAAFGVSDQLRSVADEELCSIEFYKETSHGKRKAKERTDFDQQAGTAVRQTLEQGGSSELELPDCAKDGLTFLYHLRSELGRGRVPSPTRVFFGSPYQVSFQPAGTQKFLLGKQQIDADQLVVTARGPASESMFIVLVARDPARTPVKITVPLEPGNFTLELAQEE